MATKKELIEAQGFSRRRLLSAFVGGAPGGKELEPAQPLRAVVAGIALTAMVILGGVFYGALRPGLPDGWDNNRLILASDTGARYVSREGTLYPIINTASARLMIPAGEFTIITTDQATLADIPIGAALGILGAPDSLPKPDMIINDGWSACQRDAVSYVAISEQVQAIATDDAVVARLDDTLYVISGSLRYEVSAGDEDAILRALGLSSAQPEDVDGTWLNLFDEGTKLAPIVVQNAGERIAGTEFRIGSAVRLQATDDIYLITEDAELAPLTPVAYQLYLLGSGGAVGDATDASTADLAALPTDPTAGGAADWPAQPLTPLVSPTETCALLTHDDGTPVTVLGTLRPDSPLDEAKSGVVVQGGHGSLVFTGSGTSSLMYLIDESGSAYPIPAATKDVLKRLGYSEKDAESVTASWLDFMTVGPALDVDAAGKTPRASAASESK